MQFLKAIFASIRWIFEFINKYFKTFVFLFIVYLVFYSGENKDITNANLKEISLQGAIISSFDILKEIKDAQDDENIKGVLFVVDSPGGALSPSVEISLAIKSLNQTKPVLVYATGTMASGSYLSSIWASKIYANPGSFIGSIGVIMQGFNISELAKKVGVSDQTISAGEYKQSGTIMREWNQKEKAALQELVDKSYNFFVNEVANARKLDINKKDEWANARVFLGADALKLGLIDKISSYYEARNELAKMSGVSNPSWKEKSNYDKFIDSLSKQSTKLMMDILAPRIM
ncbi:MAG: signal peptide peptidase SppA [Campylobacter sputorum]|uniref:signal peptide peptidase SppA n=1 Tax=Campylobacter sputorum TaxID=206 RepID=UPI000B78528B|nr:signal peptide peptidase SppA [Campylobacter sputorum]ASM38449.1 signal peptide peptidase protease IV [Campylobacter sputorum bv. paraureolyticus LMG 11764]MDY6120740.1 signal peptide peptidase SppA [Campylobacter sputorum]